MTARFLACVLVLAGCWAFLGEAAAMSCAEAAAVAEAGAGIPTGLLLAIGKVESGRADGAGGRAPWPWTIQSGGAGRFLASADEAVRAVAGLRAGGVQSIDAGCFQVNLMHHPDAFATPAEAFDPLANAWAAARFLGTLRAEFGAWEPAVAAYHSRAEALGGPYRDQVLAAWHGTAAGMGGGVRATALQVAGVRVWGPKGEIGTGPAGAVSMLVSPRLPRIIMASAR